VTREIACFIPSDAREELEMTRISAARYNRRTALRAVAALPALLALSARVARAQSSSQPLKIATIGAGHIGGTLGSLWVKAGHPVMFSSRHPEELKDLAAGLGPLAHTGTTAEAVAFADVILLAVPYAALKEIGNDFGKDLAAKQLILDASNPIVPRDGDIATWAREKGAGLATLEMIPGAKIVRAFNAIGYAKLRDGAGGTNARVGMPMAGDDAGAITIASTLVREAGLEPVVIGPLAMGKYLIPGTPLAGEHSPDEIKQIAAGLKS
jgi:predicted dinucleotide-binding enzyme